jgi:hypothetical protein
MTEAERRHLNTTVSRAMERDQIRAAIAAGTVHGSISRKLGDDLIDAARDAVGAFYVPDVGQRFKALRRAIERLEALVGRP